jgi:hypothetical protein
MAVGATRTDKDGVIAKVLNVNKKVVKIATIML